MRRGDGGAVAPGLRDFAEGKRGGAGHRAPRDFDAEIGIDRMFAGGPGFAVRESGKGAFDLADRVMV